MKNNEKECIVRGGEQEEGARAASCAVSVVVWSC